MEILARRLPLLLLGVALTSIVASLVLRWETGATALMVTQTVVLGAYFCWLLWESPTTVRSSRDAHTATDRGTVNAYATFRLVTLVTAVLLPVDWREYQPWMPPVAAVFVGAVLVRLWAISALGHFYSHRVRVVEDHQVIKVGPYRLVRHPAYAGMAISQVAFVLLFLNPFSAGALVVLLLPTLVVRIMIEEEVLMELPGYGEFTARRKRLIPLVW